MTYGNKNVGGRYVELEMWLGDPADPTKGIIIGTDHIDSFDITENMFTLLPTLHVRLSDTSRFFLSHPLCIGETINVRYSPSTTVEIEAEDEADVKPYIETSFVIQTVATSPDSQNGIYIYNVYAIYAAQTLINEVFTYPPHSIFNTRAEVLSSSEVINKVLDGTGIACIPECTFADWSAWLNANDTRGEFIDRIIDHAWVAEDDAPIAFTDVNGIMHYTSIKTVCENQSGIQLADTQQVIDGNASPKSNIVTFDNARLINGAGPVLNRGGYLMKCSVYNPYNAEKLNPLELPIHDKGAVGNAAALAGQVAGLNSMAERTDGWRSKTYTQNETYLASITNKDASQKENCTKTVNGGMWFSELHTHYNIASSHNELIRRSFFQHFINIQIDTGRQGEIYHRAENRPQLGKIIQVDFSANGKVDPAHSGPYCVAEIIHKYQKGKPYMQNITVVNDGYYGL